ncbi:acetyl-CoA synthetase-like protein [Amylostereum chailletii]|nr:acetyl-CoA synthetase-like protein [Amylostereum chailletii]
MADRSAENHFLSLLQPSFRKHADALVFRPYIGRNDKWDSVTYRDLERRLVVSRSVWESRFAGLDIKTSDIVGLWLTGRRLTDLVNTIAISALGYTPQLFGGAFNNSAMIFDLLHKSDGKAFVVDPIHNSQLSNTNDIPTFPTVDDNDMVKAIESVLARDGEGALIFDKIPAVSLDDTAVFFHSSGTTGGLPKIIPNTFKMLRTVIKDKWPAAHSKPVKGRQLVVNTLGNLAHIGSFHGFLRAVYTGSCVAQSSSMSTPPAEFLGLVRVCSLTRLVQYATFLSDLIRAAQQDEDIKEALKGLTEILHTGVALNKEDEEWARANGIKIVTVYSTTETAPLLISGTGTGLSDRLLRPIPGANPEFMPYEHLEDPSSGDRKLYEIVMRPPAPDCPPEVLRSADGIFHTNDLFEQVEEGGWVYRGRAGDWIKVVDGFCDTKNIEDNIRSECSDIVHDVVVVGTHRKYPCFVVESAMKGLDNDRRENVAREIVTRMASFNERQFAHERVQDPKRILIVEQGTLPRTKASSYLTGDSPCQQR